MEKKIQTIKAIYSAWKSDRISERAAALSYYSIISLVPLAVLGIAFASVVLGREVIETQVLSFGGAVFGAEAVLFFERVLSGVEEVTSNALYSVLGIVLLLYGASRLFLHLRHALQDIFLIEGVEKSSMMKRVMWDRGWSLVYLVISFFLAIIFIVINVFIAASLSHLEKVVGGMFSTTFFHILNTLITLFVVGGLYASLYRIGSQFRLSWKHAFIGGLVASFFFLVLNGIFAFYLQLQLFTSIFSASAFVIAILLWIYYGLQILFIGAEVADVYQREE
ncbi:MAG: YihY/virulence factor BrkB family protein [Candidatus Paceibacterota bacterium]